MMLGTTNIKFTAFIMRMVSHVKNTLHVVLLSLKSVKLDVVVC